jgi:hypothetical protein
MPGIRKQVLLYSASDQRQTREEISLSKLRLLTYKTVRFTYITTALNFRPSVLYGVYEIS